MKCAGFQSRAALIIMIAAMAGGAVAFAQSSGRRSDAPVIPSTFRGASAVVDSSAHGLWSGQRVRLMLAAREPSAAGGAVYGTIADGPFEAALQLDHGASADRRLELNGVLLRPGTNLRRESVRLSGTRQRLEFVVEGKPIDTLRWVGAVNQDRLHRVAIITHRGLSLERDEWMNTAAGVDRAWQFGASGVELDITVPYEDRATEREPRIDDLRVYHAPEVRAEITGFDSARVDRLTAMMRVPEALSRVSGTGVPFVYLDAKLRWLLPEKRDAARAALEALARFAVGQVSADPRMRIVIGAETEDAARLLTRLMEQPPHERVSWVAELTRGTELPTYFERAAAGRPGGPAALSISLLRLANGGGGFLGWFLRDLSPEWEDRLRELNRPIILWTAATAEQMDGAIAALARLQSTTAPGRAAIITPFPHRLAYRLGAAQ